MKGFNKMKCKLEKDINTCPFFNESNEQCNNAKRCTFQYDDKMVHNSYVRKKRWYEDYYK